jgi:hypothetical protein
MPSRRAGSTPDRQGDNQYGKCVTAELAYMRGYEVTTVWAALQYILK